MNRDNPEHIPVRGYRMAIYAPGLAYGFLDHTTYVFHCAFMAGKTRVLPTNIAVFGDIQQCPSENESRRKYIPESDNTDGMVPVTLTGLETAE